MQTIRVDIDKFKMDSPENFWEMNPQFAFIPPYSELKDADTSNNHSYSSRTMWVIVFMLSPDEEENLFYRRPVEERIEILKKFHPKLDWNEPIFKKCLKHFPEDCLTNVEREIIKAEKTIQDRVDLINSTEWTLDSTEIVRNEKTGQPMSLLVKGTALQLNTLQKDLEKAIKSLEQLKVKYNKEKIERRTKGKKFVHAGQNNDFWS